MRLIDADKLLEGIAELKQSPWFNDKYGYADRKEAVETIEDLCIKKEPTIDAVDRELYEQCKFDKDIAEEQLKKIVRCKDCKYFEEDLYKGLFEGDGVCFHEHWVLEDTGFEVKETDYCSYGERKNND